MFLETVSRILCCKLRLGERCWQCKNLQKAKDSRNMNHVCSCCVSKANEPNFGVICSILFAPCHACILMLQGVETSQRHTFASFELPHKHTKKAKRFRAWGATSTLRTLAAGSATLTWQLCFSLQTHSIGNQIQDPGMGHPEIIRNP